MAQGNAGLDLVLGIWRRRRWLGVAIFIAVVTVVTSVVTFLPDLYQASATVLIERQSIPEKMVPDIVPTPLESRLQSINQEALSRSRLEGMITKFGLYENLRGAASPDEVIDRMRGDISLELKGTAQKRGQGQTTVAFALTYRGSDPRKVALVANELAGFYIEQNLSDRTGKARETVEFFRRRVEEAKERLDEQERQVSEFKQRHIGELPEQQGANLATLDGLQRQLALNSEKYTAASLRRETLLKQLSEVGGGVGGGVTVDPLVAQLMKLNLELANLRTQFSDRYPEVVQLKAKIAMLEQQLTAGKDGALRGTPAPALSAINPEAARINKEVGAVDGQLAALRREESNLQGALATYRQRVENAPRRQLEFQVLSRDYETTRENFASLRKKLEEAELAEKMEQYQRGEQFRILDPATPPQAPAAPNRLVFTLLGLVVALGVAAGAMVGVEQLDSSFHTVDALQAVTQAPVLVSIPLIPTEVDAGRRRGQVWLAVAASVVGVALLVGVSYWVAKGNEQLVAKLVLRGER